MKNLNELMIDKLSLIYNTIILLENSEEGKLIDVSLLINNDYTTDDMMKIISGLLYGQEVTIEKKETPSENIELIEKAKKESVSDLYTADLESPYFSSELLEKLLEYRLEGLPIQTLINPNLKVEDLHKILSYYIHTRITPIYNEILYMDENSIRELIGHIDLGEEKVVDYLTTFNNNRTIMINKIKEYMDNYKKASERVPGHNSYTKVYMKNRYNKNN